MAIYVDPLMSCRDKRYWKWDKACHLFADNLEELHAFAAGLGLKREWFQDHPRLAHYDLTSSKRKLAVQQGAVELDTRQAVYKWRELRTKENLTRRRCGG